MQPEIQIKFLIETLSNPEIPVTSIYGSSLYKVVKTGKTLFHYDYKNQRVKAMVYTATCVIFLDNRSTYYEQMHHKCIRFNIYEEEKEALFSNLPKHSKTKMPFI